MSDIMLASEMTDGQIDDLANKLRDAARKHRGEIGKVSAQAALRSDNIGMVLFVAFRTLAEELSKQIVHIISVNRSRTPKAALKAAGRIQYVTDEVVEAMPRGKGDEVKLVYFKPDESVYKDGYLSCKALDDEYKRLGLVPDPQAQIDDNAANPVFADKTPNACQWKDKDGNWCFAALGRCSDGRMVRINRRANDWHGVWSFAGVLQGSQSLDT